MSGSRTVCAVPGLSSIFAASNTGPPSSKRPDSNSSKWLPSRTQWLLMMPAPRAMATISALLTRGRSLLLAGDLVDAIRTQPCTPIADLTYLRRGCKAGGGCKVCLCMLWCSMREAHRL
jgi:hypothetical protein